MDGMTLVYALETHDRLPKQAHRPHDFVGAIKIGKDPDYYKIELASQGRAHSSQAKVTWTEGPSRPLPPKIEHKWTWTSQTAEGGCGATQRVKEKVTLGGFEIEVFSSGRSHSVDLRVVPCA